MISTHEPSTRTDILRQAPRAWGRSSTPTFGSRRLTIQRDLLARLPDIEFVVLAPAAGLISPPLAAPVIDPASHRELLGRASSLRASVDMGPAGAAIDSPDTVSWHVLATRFADRAVVGAIRTQVYDLNGGQPLVASLFEYSGVHIADPSARQLVERGLAEYVAAQSRRCRRFYQVGGFAVAPALRGSALGPVLALAMNTLARLLGLRGGCTFATVAHNVAALDRRLGASGLHHDGHELPPFYCAAHQSLGQLLATEAGRFEPRLASTAIALAARLRASAVVVPE